MEERDAADVGGGSETLKSAPRDPFLELAEEIQALIALRAYELFESRGFAHGYDREDWLRAQSEIVLHVPVDVTETETEVTVRADVPGLGENDLEVRVMPRALCLTGKRHVAANPAEQTVYSERRADRIFRALDLPSEVDPDTADATLENGILEIKLLKVGTGKKIPVRTRAASA